jgi:hypothetical protein
MKQMSHGWDTALPKEVRVLRLGGKKFTRDGVGEVLHVIVNALDAVDKARAVLTGHIAHRDEHLPEWLQLQANLDSFLRNLLGDKSTALSHFGLAPTPERKKPSAETEAMAAELRRQTRAVRGTLGKRQRERITREGKYSLQITSPSGETTTLSPDGPKEPNAPKPGTAGNKKR